MADEALWLLASMEAANLLLLLAVHLRLNRVIRRMISRLVSALNLTPGNEGPSLGERIREVVTGGKTQAAPKAARGSKAEDILGLLSERTGLSQEALVGLAERYLGPGGSEGASATGGLTAGEGGLAGAGGIDPLAILLNKVVSGTLSKDDLALGVPLLLSFLRGGGNPAEAGPGPGGAQYW